MSKVFKRPMFRGGGNVNTGILSGIRDNFSNGTPSERIKKAREEFSKPAFDPVAQLLIQGGLSGFSTTGQGGTAANLAKAFEGPTAQFFSNLSTKQQSDEEMAVEGVLADINQEIENEKLKIKNLEIQQSTTQFDQQMQNKIDVKIQDGKNKIAELQFKLENPGVDSAKAGVIPSIITQQMEREKSYTDSGNLLLQQSPDFHARKTVNFERSAPAEILKDYKGVVFYGYGRKGDIEKTIPPGAGKAGDIIYDPQQSDFFIFDNEGNTYKYDLLTNSAQAGD